MRGSLPGSGENSVSGGAAGSMMPGSPTGSGFGGEFEVDNSGEMELLLDRSHSCPVCGAEFTTRVLRAGKAASNGMDMDLRPRFKNIDVIKYWVLECPVCGYADMQKIFSQVNKKELPLLKENRAGRNSEAVPEEGIRSYAEAFRKYKSVLRCNLIRGAKSSRRAYAALCTAWLLRGWRESLEEGGKTVGEKDPMSENEENKFLSYAVKFFKDAEQKEDFPISDMGEATYDYLMAALSYKLDNPANAQQYVFRALQNKEIKTGLRVKAEDLRDLLRKEKKRV
ncbi:MAG: DUF2225 domain-containing protein [Lachnospiraceae bacterium]|nr:DUF2225 domain-containing protein [Lachnospiraceae bacterium]